ncbi:MAG: pilus assembly protein TadG-related protein [Alphaproteobacteria bacterium]|nr:pilus assembly protein TadG-related protein [Alphaproteobacteria bacterium]
MSPFLASIRQFTKETGGVALPLLCLLITILVGASGAAVDIARKQLVQTRLSQALDAAGLAAASTLSSADAETEAKKYLKANFPDNYLGASSPSVLVTVSPDQSTVTISASVNMPTILMGVMGYHTMSTNVSTEIKRESKGIEVVMVLDNTGSMNSSGKLGALKTAAKAMVDALYATGTNNVWVGLVPFGQTVNIGTNHANWLNTLSPKYHWTWPTSMPWAGCVEERHWSTSSIGKANAPLTTGADLTDTPPSSSDEATQFSAYYHPCYKGNDSDYGASYAGYYYNNSGSCGWWCPSGSSYNIQTGLCDCNYGMNGNNACITCPGNTTWNSSTHQCVCNTELDVKGNCISCPSNSTWNSSAHKCLCNTGYNYNYANNTCVSICSGIPGMYLSNGQCLCDTWSGWASNGAGGCVKECGTNMKWDTSLQACVCQYTSIYYDAGNNSCVAFCPQGSNIYTSRYNAYYSNGACYCNAGFSYNSSTQSCVSGQ